MTRLKQLRNEKKMKQSELALVLKCSQQMISKYEKNYTLIPSIVEERAANYFDCSIDFLRGISDIRNTKITDSLSVEFSNLGIIKEGQALSKDQLILLRELIEINQSFFKNLSFHQSLV